MTKIIIANIPKLKELMILKISELEMIVNGNKIKMYEAKKNNGIGIISVINQLALFL